MVSRKNINYKAQQDAKRVPHYGIRKLSIGVASVLLGTVFYMQNGTVHADVNPTVSADNDNVNVVNKNFGTSGSTGASSTSTGVGSANSVGSMVSAGDTTNSTDPSQALVSPAEGATRQLNNAANESGSATPAGQVNAGADNSNVFVPNQLTSTVDNLSNERLSDNLSLSVKQKSNINVASLLASKVAVTGSNNMVNGGFDKATWGTLDVNAWQGSVQGDYYELTDYTGDVNHVIVPNEADFAKAGISTSGKQVGVTRNLMHSIFAYEATATDATVAFSKTDNKQVKAINADWHDTWDSQDTNRGAKLSRFDGTNLDVSNVTNMSGMLAGNQISDLSPLVGWKVDNVNDMSSMFYGNHISDISPLANWKVNNVTNMSVMFSNNQISDLSPLAKWKVDQVTDMRGMFSFNRISNLNPLANWNVNNVLYMQYMLLNNQISDLGPLSDWKVDNVTDMSEMFEQNRISNLSPLANWKVDNVTDMSEMFEQNRISNLSPLSNWNVNNVMSMGNMFAANHIINLSPLANWKVDNVGYMSGMFAGNQISDLIPLANWKVNNVTDMSAMFSNNQISDLSSLANWKVDNVTDMSGMFEQNQISDLSPLANWHVDNVTDMSEMFEQNQISDLSSLANWHVDNVTDMSEMFDDNISSIPTKTVQAKRIINFVYPEGYTGKKQDSVTQTIDVPTEEAKVELTTKDSKPSNNILDWVTKTETPISTPTDSVYFQDYTVPAIKGLLEPDKTVIAGQQADITKPINVTVTYKLLESNTNDAFALDSKNGLHEHANVNDNGGYDADFWGALDVSKFTTVKDGDNLEITGYNGDASKFIIPNIADFELNNLDQGAKQVTISSQVMRQLAKNATRIGLSKTNNQKVVAGDAIWSDAFGGMTNNLSTSFDADVGMWVYNPNLTAMDLHNLDTNNITDMSAMFNGGRNLTVVGDLDNWNTSNVTDMSGMFNYALKLTNIGDLDNWNTAKVTDMNYMFSGTSKLTNIGDLSKWDVANVTDMQAMFQWASSLTNIGNLDNWNTAKVTNMDRMFNQVSSLANIGNLSKWDVANVTDMQAMFQLASSLTNIGNLDNWNMAKVTDISYMFNQASNFANIGNLDNWNTAKVTDMSYMFSEASKLTNIGNLSKWNVANVTNMCNMFNGASSLTNIGDLDNWNTSKVTDMSGMFNHAFKLTNIGNLDNWNTAKVTDMSWMFNRASKLNNIGNLSKWDVANVTNMQAMFESTSSLTNIGDLDNWNTAKVTNMSWMFNQASKLANVGNLSKWNVVNVVDMQSMFESTSSLTNIGNLDNWNTAKVTNMNRMFSQASKLINIGNLSKWNVANVTNMMSMFDRASELINIGNLDNWNTAKVTDMSWMFSGTSKLTNIGDLSKWNVANVTNMMAMFRASSLTNIGDLDNWNTAKVTDMSYMFYLATALKRLNISNWNLTKLTDENFFQSFVSGDPNLVVIANDVKLPIWYQNELSNSSYFWNDHQAVITNNEALLKASGSVDDVTVDNAFIKRPVFYNSNGSDDAVAVLKQANQAYIKQYQSEHPGYTLNLAADVDQTDPIALANARFVSVPREVQFTIAYYDLAGKLVDSTASTHKVGEIVAVSPVAPANYVLANGQLRMNYLMYWGLNEADFLVVPKVTTTTQSKAVSRTITVQTPAGQTNNVVQTVTFTRTGYLNQVTKQTTYSAWSYGGQYQFSGYQPQPIDGYTADVVSALSVAPDSSDTTVKVAYHPISAAYEIDYQLADGTSVTKAQNVATNDGMLHLTAPQGYRLLTTVTDVQVGHSSQKLAVLVAPAEQTYTAHEILPNTVTEPLSKTVTRTVKITMPNGHIRTVKQSVKFERTAIVKADGTVSYSNWQAIGRAQFNKVFVAKRHGYHLAIMDASGKALSGVDKIDNVTAAMSDAVVSVKYVKD